MLRKSKKGIALLLAVLMLVGLLAGCSGTGGGKTKITICQWSAPNEDDNIYKRFNESQDEIEVEVMVFPEDQYSSKVSQMVAAGNAPDVIVAWECDLPVFAEAGNLVSLDSYLEKSDKIDMSDFVPAVQEMKESNGATYGLPWCVAVEILYYNKDMFDAAGVAYPTNEWTMDEFAAACEALTILNEDGSVAQYGCDGMSFVGGWWSGIGAMGDDVYVDGKLSIGEGAKKFLTMQKDLVDKQCIPAPSADGAGADLFASGMAAMTRTGNWQIKGYKDVKFNWDIAPQPQGERFYNTYHTGFYCIPTSTKNQDAAWKLIEWLMSEEGQKQYSELSANPSALLSVAKQGDWQTQGTNGPSNWDAVTVALESGHFDYTSLPAGVTGSAVEHFKSAILGQKSIDDAIADAMAEAAKVTG